MGNDKVHKKSKKTAKMDEKYLKIMMYLVPQTCERHSLTNELLRMAEIHQKKLKPFLLQFANRGNSETLQQ